MHSTTSTSLLKSLANPEDQVAWSRFAKTYTPLIHYWLGTLRVTGSDADDVTQNILVYVAQKMQDGFVYDTTKNFRGWLHVVSKQRALNYFRDQANANKYGYACQRLESEDPNNPIGAFESREYARIVSAQLLQLISSEFEASTIEAFRMQVIDEKSPSKTAECLGMTKNAVVKSRSRVLRRLREYGQGMIE